MIFVKYLIKEMFKNQLIVFFVLFLVFSCQKFIKILSIVIDGCVSKYLIFFIFSLSIPEIVKFILPISLFFSVLITFKHLHFRNEIIAMYACGLGNTIIVRGVLFVSGVTTLISIFNVFFFSPICLYYQNQFCEKVQSDFTSVKFLEHRFQFFKNINLVFSMDSYYNQKFQNVFVMQKMPNNRYFLMKANCGYVERSCNGLCWIVLNDGQYYVWDSNIVYHSNFCINTFDEYKLIINQNRKHSSMSSIFEGMFMNQLWFSSMPEACAEFHWRLILIFVVCVMAMIILPLSLMKLNQDYFLRIIPAMILYVIFFILQVSLRSYIAHGRVDLVRLVWVINIFYMLIALMLNLWDGVILRRLRWKLHLLIMKD